MAKYKLKKKVKNNLIKLFIIVILLIVGIILIKDYKYKQTYEYKLLNLNYSKEEIKVLLDNLNSDKIDELLTKEYNKDIDSESCIEWAIVKGNTTRVGSGGYGLAMLIDYIENVKGDLMIFSGDVYYMLNSEGSVIEKAAGSFLGTSVTFRVKIFEMDKIIFFDKKNEELISISLENL